jgi:tryptophan synthase alpha chain
MSRLETVFSQLKERGEKALIPFITAGDPDLVTTAALIPALAQAGADVIELGVPFSDPMADGPTIQAASERALANGVTQEKILAMVAEVRRKTEVPIVLMGYYNPIFRYGVERFTADAAAVGVDGLLIVDLPPEEAGEITDAMTASGLDLITLLAPTTPPERMQRLAAVAKGYLYYVSMTGVTGAQKIAPEDIRMAVSALKDMTTVPVGVGFGITTAEDAASVGEFADGVVVGSALVKLIHEYAGRPELLEKVGGFISQLKSGLLPAAN